MAKAGDVVTRARHRVIDFVFARRPKTAIAGLTLILAGVWAALALLLLGKLSNPELERPGLIDIAVNEQATPQVSQWTSILRREDDGQSTQLGGISQASPQDKAWLDVAVCRAGLKGSAQRGARAWRIRNNPELCTQQQQTMAVAPLNIKFGAFLGVILSVAIAGGCAYAFVKALLALARIGRAYRRLFASEYRVDRLRAAKA